MRTTKLLPILATTIAAGLLVLATTSNAAFAQASTSTSGGQSLIALATQQNANCQSGGDTSGSCNQASTITNTGNSVSAGGPSGSSSVSAIGLSASQSTHVQSGGDTTNSGVQTATINNQGNAVSSAGTP